MTTGILENVNWFGAVGQISYWLLYITAAVVLLGLFWFAIQWTSYKLKLTVWPMYGSGKDGVFAFDKPKKNRIKWNKKKTSWLQLWPLFNKKQSEPFDSEYIYPGNNIYGFELNGEIIPARINIKKDENTLRAEINPVPHYVRNWQSLDHKRDAIELTEKDWWTDNKGFVYMLLSVLICCALCGLTIWLSYKFVGTGREDVQAITNAISEMVKFNQIPGK